MKFYRSARLMSFILAATMACGTTAMAANSVNEQNLPAKVMNESDAPVVVSSEITGTAMGLGSVDVLGVYVRENPTKDSEILTMVGQSDNVLVLSKEGDWYRVNCNGVTGFVSKDYMTVADSGDADLGYGLVKSGANIRTEPKEDSETVESIAEEDVVTITGITDGWYQIALGDGGSGYVRSDLIDPTAEIPAEKIFDYAVIECAAANLRSAPDADADKMDVLFNGSLCTLVEQVGDWYQVEYGETTGYIYAPLMSATNDESDGSTEVETLSEATERIEAEEAAAAAAAAAEEASHHHSDPAPHNDEPEETYSEPEYDEPEYEEEDSYDEYEEEDSYDEYEEEDSYEEPEYEEEDSYDEYEEEDTYEEPSYNSSIGDQIVSVAMEYLGVPYVYGGTSPYGFDCSGFVQYVYNRCGYYISRTAQPQYSDGYYVSYSDLQPGDLVFFSATDGSAYSSSIDGISHVGIYIGGGQFIHAGGSQVKITSLNDDWCSPKYWGACRIV